MSSSGRNFLYGALHPYFGIYFLSAFVFALYRLFRQLRSASGMRRLQLRYLLLGILLGGIGAITTNLVIPLISGTSRYSLSDPTSPFVAGFAAHAIIRYRLMDIRIVIKRGVIYASGIAVAVSLFVGFTIWTPFTGDQTDKISFSTATVIAVVTAVLFQPLNTILRPCSIATCIGAVTTTSGRFVMQVGDSADLDPVELLRQLVTVIESVLRVERVCVYLPSDDSL